MDAGSGIEELRESTHDAVAAIQQLVGQLSSSATPPTQSQLAEIISSSACRLLVGRDQEGQIVGMLTLVLFPIPTGLRAWIEDVVVDRSARGHGLGARLVREAISVARGAGARSVDLTSRPDRESANALYVREGFKLRDSNVYRVTL
jgi:ribosomal protein S18 acetylase RimI-like enzyme